MDTLLKREKKDEIGNCLSFDSMNPEKAEELARLKRDNLEMHWKLIKEKDDEIEAKRKQDIREFDSISALRGAGLDSLAPGCGYSGKDSLFSKIERGEK